MGARKLKAGRQSPDDSFAAIAEHAPVMLWRGDEIGKCVYLNRAQREFWGVEDLGDFAWTSTLLPEDADKVLAPFAEGMSKQAPFTCEARYWRADGEVRILQTQAEPRFEADGSFSGMIGVNLDVTDARRGERELLESEARMRALADNLPYGMVYQIVASPDGAERRFSFVSGQCEILNGVKAEAAVADPTSLYNLILPEYREAFFAAEKAAHAAMSHFEFDAPMRHANGDVRWFRIAAAPRRAAGGETVWDGVQVDIHDIKMADERRRLLMSEMSHRIKNLLSTVISIAVQTGRVAASVDAFNASFQARLHALSRSHDLLLRDAADHADLREILEKELRPYAAETGWGRTLTLTGEPVRLAGRAALNLALVLHEMGTNAAKYGAFAAAGAIDVSWAVDHAAAGAPVTMLWTEQGGPSVTQPARSGFGSKLIKVILTSELGGAAELDFASSGLRARLTFRTR